MTKPTLIIFLIVYVGFLHFIISCSPEACFEETNSFLKASLYNNDTGKLLAPDSLTLYGLNMGTNKLYSKARNIQPALIPLNASTDNCVFIIRLNGISDTLSLNYSSYPHLITKECGYTFFHILDSYSVTNNIIDTIIIRNRKISTVNEENVRIFY